MYKLLAEAPDPYPLLDLAVDQAVKVSQTASLEAEVARLKQSNAELNAKVDSMSVNDRERRKAEKRVESLEERLEEMVKERVVSKENELKATYDERIMNLQERYITSYASSFYIAKVVIEKKTFSVKLPHPCRICVISELPMKQKKLN